jgi:hypothetical protein
MCNGPSSLVHCLVYEDEEQAQKSWRQVFVIILTVQE